MSTPTHQSLLAPEGGVRRRRAFSLLEAIIASVVLFILCVSLLALTVTARRSINRTLIRNVAFDTAQGLLDQMKSQPFGSLQSAVLQAASGGSADFSLLSSLPADKDPDGTGHVTLVVNAADFTSLSPSLGMTDRVTGKGTPVARSRSEVYGNVVPSYGVKLTLNHVSGGNLGAGNAILVTLTYRYKYTSGDSDYTTGVVSYMSPNI